MITCPANLMPHSAPMVLIDRLIDVGEDFVHTQIDIRTDIPFFEKGKVPSYVGIEYMAQTIAVWSGFQSKKQGDMPKIGFLLGSRLLDLKVSHFFEGGTLDVYGHLIFNSEEMASFDCWIDQDGQRLSNAKLNVFQPEDATVILKTKE